VSPRVRRFAVIAAAALWCGAIGIGLSEYFVEATTRGDTGITPARWPGDSTLVRGADATVVMFVHPDCPCSRASLAELATLADGDATTIVVFAGTDHGAAWDAAGRIPQVVRVVDDGREAARFGARTSGYTVVYDRDGVQRFAGGITGSRGHTGANVGSEAVRMFLAGMAGAPASHPVFGCPIGGS
jgi:hypothetical protein